MIDKKGEIKVSTYETWKKRQRIGVYRPKTRIEMRKEHAFPLFCRIGEMFLALGGGFSFFVSGLFIGVRGFFGFRKKMNEVDRYRVKKLKKVVK